MEKICSFYINDWHLVVMLLPYIKKEIEGHKTVVTFLENNLEENIFTLLSKLNFTEDTKGKIKSIKWNSTKIIKYTEIVNTLKKAKGEITVLVRGNKEYIENINKSISKFVKNNKSKKIKIVNCYEVNGFKNVNEILKQHSKLLNTAGEQIIEEVFENEKEKKMKSI